MTKTILIHADSLALPRDHVAYEQTWPAHIRQSMPDMHIINKSEGNKTTNNLHREYEHENKRLLEYYDPSIVVIQLGIADCAPRYFRQTESAVISRSPEPIRRATLFAGQRLRSRSSKRAYVEPQQFKINMAKFLQRIYIMNNATCILINILSPGKKYRNKNPKAPRSIQQYNRIINNVAEQFDFSTSLRPLADSVEEELQMVDSHTVSDGYHLAPKGHAQLARRLKHRIEQWELFSETRDIYGEEE